MWISSETSKERYQTCSCENFSKVSSSIKCSKSVHFFGSDFATCLYQFCRTSHCLPLSPMFKIAISSEVWIKCSLTYNCQDYHTPTDSSISSFDISITLIHLQWLSMHVVFIQNWQSMHCLTAYISGIIVSRNLHYLKPCNTPLLCSEFPLYNGSILKM